MKIHLQKTRIQNGKVLRYSTPECGKSGSSNVALMIVGAESFNAYAKENRKECCVNCLAALIVK